jgi:PAS domain S-box-containing protein
MKAYNKKEEQILKAAGDQGILEAIGDGICIQGIDYRIVYQNKKAKEMIGDHVGEYCYGIYGKKDAVCDGCPLELSFRDDQVHTAERCITNDSRELIVEITSSALKDSAGKMIAGIEVIRDVTKRKTSEEKIRVSEREYRELVDRAPVGVYQSNIRGEILFINEAVAKIFEFDSPEEMMSEYRNVLTVYKDPKKRDFLIEHLKREGYIQNFRFEAKSKTGKTMHILLSAALSGDILSGMLMDVTEQKKAEEELQKSEERFKMLAEQSPSMIFINKGGKIVYVNKKCEEMMGYSKAEFLSDDFSFMSLIATDCRDLVRENYRKHMNGQDIPPYDYKLITKDGKELSAIHSTKLIDYEGEKAILGIVTDITDRKHMEEELRREKEFSENIIDSSVDGILAFDREYRYTTWNSGMELISGIKKEQTIGQNAFKVFPFLKQTGEDKFFHEALNGKTIIAKDRPYMVTETGRKGFFEGYYSPLKDVKGEIVGGLAIIRDITERKQAEESLKLFRNLINQSNDAIFIIDAETGHFLDVNDKACGNLRYTREELLTMKITDIEEIIQKQSQWIEHVNEVQEKGFMLLEGNHRRKDNTTFPVEINVKHVTLGQNKYMIAVARDISERKQAEKALVESRKKLKAQTEELIESNAALKVLLKQRDYDKREFEENMLSNIKHLILPYIEKLKKNREMADGLSYLNIVESNLNEIISPFSSKLSSRYLGFTPKEIQIADLIKDGKQDKDIMEMLHISLETVKTHRQNIRKKLGLYSTRTNLRSYLLSMVK